VFPREKSLVGEQNDFFVRTPLCISPFDLKIVANIDLPIQICQESFLQ